MLGCEQCHAARGSAETADVLLPGIDTCLRCHHHGAKATARADCVECHVYHDPAAQRASRGKGRLTIYEILGR